MKHLFEVIYKQAEHFGNPSKAGPSIKKWGRQEVLVESDTFSRLPWTKVSLSSYKLSRVISYYEFLLILLESY